MKLRSDKESTASYGFSSFAIGGLNTNHKRLTGSDFRTKSDIARPKPKVTGFTARVESAKTLQDE